jgi:hypothetical protein
MHENRAEFFSAGGYCGKSVENAVIEIVRQIEMTD